MSNRARAQMVLGLFLIVMVLVAVGAYASWPILASFMPSKQAIVVVLGGNSLKIADTWIDGTFTTDSGTSNLKSEQQAVYLPQSVLGQSSIDQQGSVNYNVKTISYSFKDVAKVFGVQIEALIYKANITVQVTATQVDGNAVYKINGPTNVVSGWTHDVEGQVQVPVNGITDITSELKSRSAPYGTYIIKVTAIESWTLWTYNPTLPILVWSSGPLGAALWCWIMKSVAGLDWCNQLKAVQGPSTSILQEQTDQVTYGEVNAPTFYMAMPTDVITVGTKSGQTQAFDLAFIPAGGFTGTVHVAFSNTPTGMTIDNQDNHGQFDIPLPAATVTFAVTVNTNTPLGNYTITATGTSGTITKQGTFVVQVVENGGPPQCPPFCNQANTVLAADTTKTSYAPYDIVTLNGALTVTNGVGVSGGEIDIADQVTGNVIAKVATGSDGKFSATWLAPSSAGDYTVTVSFPGDMYHTAASAIVKYSVNNLPPTMLYIIIGIVAVVIVLVIAGIAMSRRRPGGP
jgi:hypothetical protein